MKTIVLTLRSFRFPRHGCGVDAQHEDPRTTSMDDLSPQDMSWVERKRAEATWRYRVKHWTRSQRRERVRRLISLKQGLANGNVTLVGYTSTDGPEGP